MKNEAHGRGRASKEEEVYCTKETTLDRQEGSQKGATNKEVVSSVFYAFVNWGVI